VLAVRHKITTHHVGGKQERPVSRHGATNKGKNDHETHHDDDFDNVP